MSKQELHKEFKIWYDKWISKHSWWRRTIIVWAHTVNPDCIDHEYAMWLERRILKEQKDE